VRWFYLGGVAAVSLAGLTDTLRLGVTFGDAAVLCGILLLASEVAALREKKG
jgi:hypothetical protein